MSDPDTLYKAHVDELRRRFDDALEHCGYSAVVLAAGRPHDVFLDDQQLPFKANPHLLQWGPLNEHPGSVLVIRAGEIPRLLVHTPVDFWHSVPPVPGLFAASGMEIETVATHDAIAAAVQALTGPTAFVGESAADADSFRLSDRNPEALLTCLNEYRTVKTDWEVMNLKAASLTGVRGHLAAQDAFAGGGSEYDIQLAFRMACNVTDNEMPYPAIVALNKHAATLHYQRLDRERGAHRSLLIDAGHAVNGYASDITRSHSGDPEFGAIIEAMHELQRNLCAAALPGVDYRDLHHAAHLAIAGLLQEIGVVKATAQDAVDAGVSRVFFPHGLGHFLGLQVHDVGALYTRRSPDTPVPEGEDKYLRLTRKLQAGNVLTIEPGIYFIDSLLAELRAGPQADLVDWQRTEQLRPFGGIRIEDNLHVTADGNENLTRSAFSSLTAA